MMWNLGSGAEFFSGWVSNLQAWPEPLLCLGSVVFLATVLPAGLLTVHLRLSRHLRSTAGSATPPSREGLRSDADSHAESLVLAAR